MTGHNLTKEQAIQIIEDIKRMYQYNLTNEQSEYRSEVDLQIFRERVYACEMAVEALKTATVYIHNVGTLTIQ